MVGRRAFTLIELLVIIAIIALLLTLIGPALVSARSQSRCVTCMANMRQISQAYFAYSSDHDGLLVPCDQAIKQQSLVLDRQPYDIPELRPYVGDSRVFHCIEDQREGCRTYAINDYLGGFFPFQKMKHVRDLKSVANAPKTFLFIEETPTGLKNGYLGGFVVLPYPVDRWADTPAVLHPRGTCLSFADGHCEFWQWSDYRTHLLSGLVQFPASDGNPDLRRLQGCSGQPGTPIQ